MKNELTMIVLDELGLPLSCGENQDPKGMGTPTRWKWVGNQGLCVSVRGAQVVSAANELKK